MELEIGRVIEACDARVLVEPVSRDVAALGLTWDSREVKPGFVYAAIVGERVDGHAFAASAIEAGAVAVGNVKIALALKLYTALGGAETAGITKC